MADNIEDNFDHILLVLDSMGKPESGILYGNVQWLGTFDQCKRVVAMYTGSSQIAFRGKYCTSQHLVNQNISVSTLFAQNAQSTIYM